MFSGSYEGDQLRTRIVFFSASAIFAFGLWAYLFGATSPLGKTTDVQFDGLSLVPGIIAVCGMVMLNTLVDRSVLTSEGMEMFSNALPARFCVFVIAIVNLCAVAIAILLAMHKYTDRRALGTALCVQTTAFATSAFIIFFGRKVDPSYF